MGMRTGDAGDGIARRRVVGLVCVVVG